MAEEGKVQAVKGLKRLRSGKELTRMAKGDGKPKCETCGCRVRSKGHDNGSHHRSKS